MTTAQRRAVTSRAAELFNVYAADCVEAQVGLTDMDVAILWDAAIKTASDEQGLPW